MPNIPLAERLRPRTLDEYIGQRHLVGPDGVFRRFFETGNVPSFILWGPPGVGKTTLARIVATQLERPFFTLSAVTSGVKEVREVIESARKQRFFDARPPFLFIDEIHRFNKSQQDSLLGAVEQGIFTLIGATTENPSFEVIPPLLSRCQVYVLKPLEDEDLRVLLDRALATDTELREREIEVVETGALFRFAGGDARRLLNILDIVTGATHGRVVLDDRYVTDCLQENIALYDKNGEQHYDVISAFIKSVRGSDPNAAIYYLARMLAGGEEPRFIARRLVILASEDVGLANPNALLLANACFDTVHKIGHQQGAGARGARPLEPSRAAAPAQCADQADEARGVRRRLQIRPRLSGQLRRAGVPARHARRHEVLRAEHLEFHRGPHCRAHRRMVAREVLIGALSCGVGAAF